MSSEMERQFVEGAARAAYVMAWAEREENPPEGLREIEWHFRTSAKFINTARGVWGERQLQGHRKFYLPPEGRPLFLFDDEVDSDEPVPARSFAGQRLEDVAPPTPDYAREWAWKLLGVLEEINPQWGRNLPSVIAAANRACELNAHGLHEFTEEEIVRAFGSDIAMMALGTGVSWFDGHADFELHVPQWDARGFKLEGD